MRPYEPKSSRSGGQGTFANGVYTEPAGTGGYVWKHMYTLTTGDVLAFLSTDFMPVAASGEASRVAAEALAAQEGIGFLIWNARTFFRTDFIFVGIICFGGLGFICDRLWKLFGRTIISRYLTKLGNY